jgi:hypothetical protein
LLSKIRMFAPTEYEIREQVMITLFFLRNFGSYTRKRSITVTAVCLLPLKQWGRGFQSHSSHVYLCAYYVFVLASV